MQLQINYGLQYLVQDKIIDLYLIAVSNKPRIEKGLKTMVLLIIRLILGLPGITNGLTDVWFNFWVREFVSLFLVDKYLNTNNHEKKVIN